MPRPTITRNIYQLPIYKKFGPLDRSFDGDIIIMSIEEYETIRLIDELNHNQAECALEMGIGRTTALEFEGGNYTIRGKGQGHNRHRGQGMGRNRR